MESNNINTVPIVPKLWGYEKWLENNDKYCSKLLSLNKGYQFRTHLKNSLQWEDPRPFPSFSAARRDFLRKRRVYFPEKDRAFRSKSPGNGLRPIFEMGSSLHYHKHKDEMFLVTKGHVRLELGENIFDLHEGHFVRVLPGTPHRFAGIEDSLIMETSTHHEEDDSYRIEESRKMD